MNRNEQNNLQKINKTVNKMCKNELNNSESEWTKTKWPKQNKGQNSKENNRVNEIGRNNQEKEQIN